MENKLVILGNGFDLQCGLKSSYESFFCEKYSINLIAQICSDKEAKKRFVKIFRKAIDEVCDKKELKNANGYLINLFHEKYITEYLNINSNCTKLSEQIENSKKIKFTNWDITFITSYVLMNNVDCWKDIEEIILEVITIVLKNSDNTNIVSKKYFVDKKSEEKFKNIVSYCFKEYNKDPATSMLDSLKKFEKSFAKYIQKQKSNKDYKENAEKLLNKIAKQNDKEVSLDVINFNYSLDETDLSQINFNINTWTNIHGIANWNDNETRTVINKNHAQSNKKILPPIFGVDAHDILSRVSGGEINDSRVIFTKVLRLINDQNYITQSKKFQSKINQIIFYGHSLGHADYSYFEALFDIYKIFDSNVELIFYYHKHSKPFDDRKSKMKVLSDLLNLLVSYGQTTSAEHGENLVSKLILEKRLKLLSSF